MNLRIPALAANVLAWARQNEQRAAQALAGLVDRAPASAMRKLSNGGHGIVLPSAVGEQSAGEQLDPARVQRVADIAERLRRARQEGQA